MVRYFQGNFAGRIQVQANDEVFDATRQKVCVLDKLAKEKQTKEIRQSGKGSSGHAKVNKIFSNLAKSTGSNQRPVTPIHSKRVSPVLSQSQKPSELLNKPKSESKGSGTKPKISPASHSSAISPVNSNMSSSVQPFPSISGRPLRQRIIQLLIVRPYSKAELLLRLQQDGLNDGDKTKFSEILTEVCQSKGNDKWGLNRSFYHEVDLNWPAYDAYNKSVVKRNLEAVQTLSEGGGSGANGGGQNPLKRAKPSGAYEDEDCIPGVKVNLTIVRARSQLLRCVAICGCGEDSLAGTDTKV